MPTESFLLPWGPVGSSQHRGMPPLGVRRPLLQERSRHSTWSGSAGPGPGGPALPAGALPFQGRPSLSSPVKGAALHHSMYALPLSCGLGKCNKTGVSGLDGQEWLPSWILRA